MSDPLIFERAFVLCYRIFERKQQMLAQVYPVLKGEIDTDRALTQRSSSSS